MRVARGIGALDMDDGNVRLDRADGKQARSTEGILDRANSGMAAHDVAPEPGEGREVGEAHRCRLER